MIVSNSTRCWQCPKCGKPDLAAPPKGAIHRTCPTCQYVLPHVTDDATSLEFLPVDPDDETWTQKWGPIHADRYQVVRVLAAGAQGKLLLANQRRLDIPCVIKLVANNDRDWADIANRRLRNEALAGARVNHPHVARVFDCDNAGDAWYFVMEYVIGENLRRILQQAHRLCWRQVVDIARQTTQGLAAIHKVGLIHRDIKPSNLMLNEDGDVKIMDLGLAKLPHAAADVALTHAGQVLGTPLYMPPEQFAAAELDPRADIYALGATLYHLLTGHPPFEGSNITRIADRHRADPVRFSDDDRDASPNWLRDIIESCLAKTPDARYPSAADLLNALEEQSPAQSRNLTSRHDRLPDKGVSCGVTVMPFRNLSRQNADDWIGDAIAEYVSSALIRRPGVHVADYAIVNRIIRQTTSSNAGDPPSSSTPEDEPPRDAIMSAARLAGVRHVILGSYQRQSDQLRIVAHALTRDSSTVTFLASVQGAADDLFTLQDQLTDAIMETLSFKSNPAGDPAKRSPGASNPKAHEHYVLARRAFAAGDYAQALRQAEQARQHDDQYGDPLSLMGACHARLGEYERAIDCHHRREELAAAAEDDAGLVDSLSNLGAVYYYQGEYAVAYEFLERAAKTTRDLDPTPDSSKLYANLGMVLMRLDRAADAEQAFAKAIDISKQFDDLVSMVWPYNGMGTVLLKQDRVAEGREYHQRALALAEEVGDRVMVGVSQMNIGRSACLLAEFPQADLWFSSALAALEQTNFWNGLTLVYEHMAESQLMQDRPADALRFITKRIELAQRHGNRRMEAEAWEQKARALEKTGQTTDALAALKKSVALSQQPPAYESLHRLMEGAHARKPRSSKN